MPTAPAPFLVVPRPRALLLAVTAILLLAIALGAVPAAARAATWRQFTGPTSTNLTILQGVRDPSGVLHEVWSATQSGTSAGPEAIFERDLMPNGTYGAIRTLVAPLSTADAPGIARNPADGRIWVFGASAGDYDGKLFAVNTADGFATTSAPAEVSTTGSAYSADIASAAFTSTGQAYEAFGARLKSGTDVEPEEDDITTAPGLDIGIHSLCCIYMTVVDVDAVSNEPYVGYYSNVDPDRAGLEVFSLASGTLQYVPGSATPNRQDSLYSGAPTAMTARIGAPGVFVGYCVGYPTCQKVQLWRAGTTKARIVAAMPDADDVAIAAAPGGKLWVLWSNKGQVFATRSNAAATAFGPIVHVLVPGGASSSIWRLAGEGARGPLEVFAHLHYTSSDATWQTELLPGLGLAASSLKPMHGAAVTLHVTDAGVPVKGAKVTLRGKTVKTNAKGVAVLPAGAALGLAKVTATDPGFAPGTLSLHVH